MRSAPALATDGCRDGIRDVPRLDACGNEIVRDGHVDPGPFALGEQHRNGALMFRAEAIHYRSDLVTVVESGLAHIELDVADLFDGSLLPAPRSLF